jgi:hypothetical protein
MDLAVDIPVGPPRLVRQRTPDDCMVCVLAMFAGRTYEEVVRAAQQAHPAYVAGEVMTHALLRRVAHSWGLVLLSSIYMDWRSPGIVGVVSRSDPASGHALYWDGTQLHDPAGEPAYDRAYVDQNAVEFTQRAADLKALIALDEAHAPAARATTLIEYF